LGSIVRWSFNGTTMSCPCCHISLL
jgi:hypothetical protein